MTRLAAVFSDNMVLQRGKKICIFGESDENNIKAVLTDEAGREVASGVSEAEQGSFKLYIQPLDAGGPYTLTVNEKSFENVYIGEVWLAGGQSNMELELQNSFNGKEAVENLGKHEADKRVRFYYTPKVPDISEELYKAEAESCWQTTESEWAKCWSAVGYYYARFLAEKLDCMIGIIGCNWGGTSAASWTSREMLLAHKETKGYIERYDEVVSSQDPDEYLKEYEDYQVYQKRFDQLVGEYYRTSENPSWDEAVALYGPNKYPGPMGPKNFLRPAGIYESMLKRIAPYTLKGFIFYQGEEDDNRPYTYEKLLSVMIDNWRQVFEDEALPFINVQLPIFLDEGERDDNHGPWRNWPFIREAQYMLTKSKADYYMAVALDKGEYHNIHPLDKETIGKRLSLQALSKVYGIDTRINPDPPVYKKMLAMGNRLLLSFDNAEGGIELRESQNKKPSVMNMETGEILQEGSNGEPIELMFEIAGPDKVFYQASEVIVGDIELDDGTYQIMVYSCNVLNPRYVRYFWTNYGEVRLYGQNGIPVMPFRSNREDGAMANHSRQGEIL